ncbi:hypothetical protein ACFS7Z_22825 [Pontibacter toksunensis]|uniref:SpoIIAA-like protein n=1 Tax=Pontibacter toksunensis TaxID=1332631 RepID=A0ABW6C3M9_9BACT
MLAKALQCATAHQLTAWLCDTRQLYYIDIADLNWMLQNLFPYFDMQKQHRVALLVNKSNFDLVANVPSENENAFNSGFGSFIDMIYFLDKDAAAQWLLV